MHITEETRRKWQHYRDLLAAATSASPPAADDSHLSRAAQPAAKRAKREAAAPMPVDADSTSHASAGADAEAADDADMHDTAGCVFVNHAGAKQPRSP